MALTQDRWIASVKECRKIYADMPEKDFIRWYHRKYKLPVKTIMQILGTTEAPRNL